MTSAARLASGSRPRLSSERRTIAGPLGPLEAIVDRTHGPTRSTAVVCHPHPLHRGTMNNKVTHTLARYFVRRGGLAVRFNFRGVGASAGTYDGGDGETDDAAAVIEWVCERHPGVPLYLAGFSFGAMVSIRAAVGRQVAALVTVAPPVRFFRNGFTHPGCPWLVIQGLADEIVPAEAVRAWCETLDPRPALSTVPDADHFFHGALPLLGDAIDEFLDSIEPVRTRTGGTAAC